MVHFTELTPQEAYIRFKDTGNGALDSDVILPHDECGNPCPFPWDPIQLKGAPIGMYHCPYCGAMVIAGLDHTDYGPNGFQEPDEEYFGEPPEMVAGEYGWQPGSPCYTCGSTDTVMVDTGVYKTAHCRGCGRYDDDE